MPPGIGYGKKLGRPNEQDMFGDALMQQFGEAGTIDGTGRTMPGGGVVGPQPGANQTQPFGAPQKLADPSMPGNPSAPAASSGRTGFGGMSLEFGGARSPMGATGFNVERASAGGDPNSVKDGIYRTAMESGIDVRGLDKAQTGEILRSQFLPLLHQRGIQARMSPDSYDVVEVFSNERGWEPVDIIEKAGSPDARWAYQALLDGGAAPAGGAQVASRPGGGSLNGMFGQVGNDATMAAILAEIEKYIDPQQMQALLGGALFEQMQGGQEPLL